MYFVNTKDGSCVKRSLTLLQYDDVRSIRSMYDNKFLERLNLLENRIFALKKYFADLFF